MPWWMWAAFVGFVLVMLALDLFVVNRKAHVIRVGASLAWTGVTVVLALGFAGVVYWIYENRLFGIADDPVNNVGGAKATALYLTAWMLEYALSLDNIMVIAIVFQFFAIPAMYQHRVLFWGVLGALVMRGAMILAGSALIEAFDWMLYVFGVVLLLTAVKLLFAGEAEPNPEKNIVVRMARRVLPVTPGLEGERFFARLPAPEGRARGALAMTPMFLVLLVVETTDVIFAVDSIPAAFGVTRDPFLVFTSNVFAILGLRSLYFALAAFIEKLRFLKVALIVVLLFIAVKMLIHSIVHVDPVVSLGVVAGILMVGVAASLAIPKKADAHG